MLSARETSPSIASLLLRTNDTKTMSFSSPWEPLTVDIFTDAISRNLRRFYKTHSQYSVGTYYTNLAYHNDVVHCFHIQLFPTLRVFNKNLVLNTFKWKYVFKSHYSKNGDLNFNFDTAYFLFGITMELIAKLNLSFTSNETPH